MPSDIKCNEKMGIIKCRFESDYILFNKYSDKINIDIYITDDCPYCSDMNKYIKKVIKPIHNKINLITHNCDKEKCPVDIFPSIKIGDLIINGIPEENKVWNALKNDTI